MADSADRAADWIEGWLEEARHHRQTASNPSPEWRDNGTAVCVECGSDNTPRARIGRGRCIECQEEVDSAP